MSSDIGRLASVTSWALSRPGPRVTLTIPTYAYLVLAASAAARGFRGPGNRALIRERVIRARLARRRRSVAELRATTTTPPAGMRGPASPAVQLRGSLNPAA